MKRSLPLILIFSFILLALPSENVFSQDADSLRGLIDSKNEELQAIQDEKEGLEKNLEETNQLGRSLKRDIGNINYNINQLDLSIKANRIVLEKLGLEIDSLHEEIKNIEESVINKKETIAKLLVQLQQKDRENILVIFLKHKNLTDSVSEAQSIIKLNNGLAVSAQELREFQQQLTQKADNEKDKKRDRQVEQSNLNNRQVIVQDQKAEKNYLLQQTKNQEKIYEQQIDELNEKQDEISKVIEEFEHQLRSTFDPSLLPIKRPGVFAYPTKDVYVTQKYGKTKFAERAYRTKSHGGTDFRASVGTPIFAAEDGQIIAVDNNDRGTSRWNKYQYGKYVLIEHNNNLTTLYAHLSRQIVSEGDVVERGDLIGYAGNTGYSTGAHLHFGVYWAPSVQFKKIAPAAGLVPLGVTIDPQDYL